jgi:hypothetical protein
MAKEEEVTEEECLNGVVFTDLAKAGENVVMLKLSLKVLSINLVNVYLCLKLKEIIFII